MSFAVDANLLVYASNEDCPEHSRANRFLRHCAAGPDVFCLAWPTIVAYLRIATHAAVFRRPLTPDTAIANIDRLLALPHVRLIAEDERFWPRYRDLAGAIRPRGNLVPDTHLAALLRHHGVTTFYTRDRDFLRFDFLVIVDPLETAVRETRRRRRAR